MLRHKPPKKAQRLWCQLHGPGHIADIRAGRARVNQMMRVVTTGCRAKIRPKVSQRQFRPEAKIQNWVGARVSELDMAAPRLL